MAFWIESHQSLSKHRTHGLWTFPNNHSAQTGHPCPFPLELPRRCIKLFSYRSGRCPPRQARAGQRAQAGVRRDRAIARGQGV